MRDSTKNSLKLTYTHLFLDLDGTLLSAFKKVTKDCLVALQKFSELGGEVIIATGKTFSNSQKYIDAINAYLLTPIKFIACLNGNQIYDLRGNAPKLIYEGLIQNSDCKQIYHTCKRNNVIFVPYSKSALEKNNIHIFGHSFISNFNRFHKWNLRPSVAYQTMEAFKINMISKTFNPKRLMLVASQLNDNHNIEILRTKKVFYEVVKRNSNKGLALKLICNRLSIPVSKTVCIGDSYNDLPMMKVAGLAISVGVSNHDFRQYCKFFVKPSSRNKVSKAIIKYVI